MAITYYNTTIKNKKGSITEWEGIKFGFEVIEVEDDALKNSEDYKFKFYLYFQNNTGSKFSYLNITWNLTFYINGIPMPQDFIFESGTTWKTISKATSVVVWDGEETIKIPGYSISKRDIKVGCSFIRDENDTAGYPYSSAKTAEHNISISANATAAGTTLPHIRDLGNNTFDFYGTIGANGTNNNIKNVYIYYTTDGTAPSNTSTTAKKVQVLTTDDTDGECEGETFGKVGSKYKINPIHIPVMKDIQVRAKAYTIDTLGNNPASVESSGPVEYYSKPGVPQLRIIINNYNNTFRIAATKGVDGSNNTSTGVQIQYKTIQYGQNPSGNWKDYDGADIKIEDRITIYAQARTVGEYSDGGGVFQYSNWTVISSGAIEYSRPSTVKDLQIVNHYNNTFSINCIAGADGTNNSTDKVEISYTIGNNKKSWKESCAADDSIITDDIKLDSKDITDTTNSTVNVKVIAYTIGSVDNPRYKYSEKTENTFKVPYYKKATLSAPTIEYEKKLTKKSTIKVKYGTVTMSPNTGLKEYTWELYKNDNILLDKGTLTDISDDGFNIDLAQYTLKKDDRIKIKLNYFIYPLKSSSPPKYNTNYQQLCGYIFSGEYIIQSSGVMRVKVGDTWHEGQVWVKVNGEWKEASDVFVNVDGKWKESI